MPVSVCRVFDSAGTGRISVAELRNILFRIGYSPLQQEMENIDDIVRVGRGYISIYTLSRYLHCAGVQQWRGRQCGLCRPRQAPHLQDQIHHGRRYQRWAVECVVSVDRAMTSEALITGIKCLILTLFAAGFTSQCAGVRIVSAPISTYLRIYVSTLGTPRHAAAVSTLYSAGHWHCTTAGDDSSLAWCNSVTV